MNPSLGQLVRRVKRRLLLDEEEGYLRGEINNAAIDRKVAESVRKFSVDIDYDIHEGVIHVFPIAIPDRVPQAPKMDIEARNLLAPELIDLPAEKFHVQKTK